MTFIMGKIVNGKITPFRPPCVVNGCSNRSAGLFAWPDENTAVELCEKHARVLMANIRFAQKALEDE